ncbi:MAG: D-alanyl-D-alanine carboxypeptidase family protein [Clostridia bacterium]|nr:D-alanyl-D-alanine carboxypeptidase family protein [Clostridia bacterium]
MMAHAKDIRFQEVFIILLVVLTFVSCKQNSFPTMPIFGLLSEIKMERPHAGTPAVDKPRYPGIAGIESEWMAAEIKDVTDDWLLLVNKTHPLSKEYAPTDMVHIKYCVGNHAESMRYMRAVPAEYFHEMIEAAAAAGYEIGIRTAYRSYEQQYNIFWNYVAKDGEEAANKYSARPGQSEHQTGLCADVTSPSVEYTLTTDYGQTPEGIWLSENAHYYGFIIRYPLGKENITGYQYEPWHVRYVGEKAATEMVERGLTLEEYLGEQVE